MPGTPVGAVVVPLNADGFTSVVLGNVNSAVFFGFLGTLDGSGRAAARLDTRGLLNQSWAGAVMHYAYILVPFDFASNPVAVEVMPW